MKFEVLKNIANHNTQTHAPGEIVDHTVFQQDGVNEEECRFRVDRLVSLGALAPVSEDAAPKAKKGAAKAEKTKPEEPETPSTE